MLLLLVVSVNISFPGVCFLYRKISISLTQPVATQKKNARRFIACLGTYLAAYLLWE